MRNWHIFYAGQGQGHLRSMVMMSHEIVQTFLSIYMANIGCKVIWYEDICHYKYCDLESTFHSHTRLKVMI